MWNRQLQMVRLAKGTCKRSGKQIAVLLSPPSPFDHSRCFSSKGADGAADLLEVLRNSPLEKLNFSHCSQIPSAAWQKLRGASWSNLREANFSECLVLQTWLRCLASSLRRCVFFSNVKGHCQGCFFDNIWQRWKAKKCEIDSCKWSDLQKALARGAATNCRPFIPTVLFRALQVLPGWHQGCRWGRRSAGSLARLFPGEVELRFLRSNSVQCVAASSQWRVACTEWCTRHPRGGVVKDYFWRPIDGSFWRGRLVLASDSGRTSEPWVEKPDCFRVRKLLCCEIYCHVMRFIRTQVEKHVLPSFPIVQLDGVQTLFGWKSFNLYTRLRWNWWNHCISLPWLSTWLVQRPQKNL